MSKKQQIIISAASLTAALSAIHTSAANDQTLVVPSKTGFEKSAAELIATAQAQESIRFAMPAITRTIRVNAALNSAPYAQLAQAAETGEEAAEEGEEEEEGSTGIALDGDFLDALMSEDDLDFTDEEMEAMAEQLGVEIPEGMSASEYFDSIDTSLDEVLENVISPEGLEEGVNQIVQGALTNSGIDSTSSADSYFSCYGNCHSACHGSRGWR